MECGVLNKMQWTFYPIILEWVWYFEKCQIISIDLHYKEEFDDLKMIPAWVKSALIRTGIGCFGIKKIDRILLQKNIFYIGCICIVHSYFHGKQHPNLKRLSIALWNKRSQCQNGWPSILVTNIWSPLCCF